ncbi:hypothetical protein Leryth_007605 [Lithospermum erythrorhizon]|nr:hypothetical protein Leryth_007605 [Lithospermum erythrorhizon]
MAEIIFRGPRSGFTPPPQNLFLHGLLLHRRVEIGSDYETRATTKMKAEKSKNNSNAKTNKPLTRIKTVPLRVHDIFIKLTQNQILRYRAEQNFSNRLQLSRELIMRSKTQIQQRKTKNIQINLSLAAIQGRLSCRVLARSWSVEGALKFRNLIGYGDLWDGSLAYGWNSLEI